MIQDILRFFQKEKFYTFLFLAVLAYVGYHGMTAPRDARKPKPAQESAAFKELRSVEEKFKAEVQKAESFEKYMEQNPGVRKAYEGLFLVLVFVFLGGLIVNTLWVFNPKFRSLFYVMRLPSVAPWKLSMLFKVVLLFVALNIPLGVGMKFVEGTVFPQVSSNFFILFHTTIIDLTALALILWVLYRGGGNWKDLGVPSNPKQFWMDAVTGMGGYLGVLPVFLFVLFALVLIATLFAYEPPPHPLVNVFLEEEKKSPLIIAYSLLLAGVAGPVLEEVFFRGFCYNIFKARLGKIWGMILSSGFFALIHMNEFSFLPIFILGMALVYLYEVRKSLVAPAVLHMTHNAFFIYYFFAMKDVITAHGSG